VTDRPEAIQTERPLGDCLISLAQVTAKTSLSRSTIYRKIAENKFPIPVQVTEFRVAWWLSEIDAWNRERPRAKLTASAA
jgi:prophage regulatory protein